MMIPRKLVHSIDFSETYFDPRTVLDFSTFTNCSIVQYIGFLRVWMRGRSIRRNFPPRLIVGAHWQWPTRLLSPSTHPHQTTTLPLLQQLLPTSCPVDPRQARYWQIRSLCCNTSISFGGRFNWAFLNSQGQLPSQPRNAPHFVYCLMARYHCFTCC